MTPPRTGITYPEDQELRNNLIKHIELSTGITLKKAKLLNEEWNEWSQKTLKELEKISKKQ